MSLVKNFSKIFRKIFFYEFDFSKQDYKKNTHSKNNFQFKIISHLDNCFASMHNNEINEYLKRFKKKHSMLALIDIKNKNIACYGWRSEESPHMIEELNKKFFFHKGSVLYDFKTVLSYRNKGLYKFLLNQIVTNFEKPLYIYSLSSNNFSNNAILKTGFKKIKVLNILSDDINQKNS